MNGGAMLASGGRRRRCGMCEASIASGAEPSKPLGTVCHTVPTSFWWEAGGVGGNGLRFAEWSEGSRSAALP
ncbi:MAG: hypothetical protein R3F19_31245 [Verrucomicrobiales bacterium]